MVSEMKSSEQSVRVTSLTALQDRLTALEHKVFGSLDKSAKYSEVTDVMLEVNCTLGRVLGDNDRAVMIMKRIDELEQYLDPLRLHKLSASPEQLAAEVSAVEPQLRQLADQLKLVQQLQPVLDSQHLKDTGSLCKRLQLLKERHSCQIERHNQLQAGLLQLKQVCSRVLDEMTVDLLQQTAERQQSS